MNEPYTHWSFICFHYIVIVHDNNPNDPAVIPTDKKNPNSIRSLEPGGILFNIV